MPGIGIGLSSAFGTKPLFYLLRDEFLDTLAAGSVNGTPATPGPGTRVVVDTDSKLSISSGNVNLAPHSVPANGDPGLWYGSLARAAGRLMITEFNRAAGAIGFWGWDLNQAGGVDDAAFRSSASNLQVGDGGWKTVGANSTATSYQIALPLRASTGSFYFIKGGAYTTWTLLWIGANENADPVYPAIVTNSATFTSSYIRIPDALWLPAPLVSDGFTNDNGTSLDAHSSDGLGHAEGVAGGLGAGGGGLSWVEQSGDWDIQANRANATGADPGAWLATVDSGDADIIQDTVVNLGVAGKGGTLIRYSDTTHFWYVRPEAGDNEIQLYENDGGFTKRASAAVAVALNTDYDIRVIAYGTTIDIYLDGGNKASYGSASLNSTATIHGLRVEDDNVRYDDFAIYARDGYSALSAF